MKLQNMHTNNLFTKHIVLRISAIIAATEFMIMLFINIIHIKLHTVLVAIVDVLLLATISTPLIYTWVIKPFVVARDEALAQISLLAFSDPLTKLSNRRNLLSHLQRAIAGCNRHKFYSALILLDLDGFKMINDELVHDAGDAVLIEVARRFTAAVRTEDITARLGGDEFVILVENLGTIEQHAREKAMKTAVKLIDQASKPIEFGDQSLQVVASAGISLIQFDNNDADLIIRQADIAMYRSKNTGKDRATFSD